MTSPLIPALMNARRDDLLRQASRPRLATSPKPPRPSRLRRFAGTLRALHSGA